MTSLGYVAPRKLIPIIFSIALALTSIAGRAQDIHPLAQQLVASRVEVEEVRFLLQVQQITSSEHQERSRAAAKQNSDISAQIRKLAPDHRAQVQRQAESLFQTRIVPLREQWRQKLIEKQALDRANNAARQLELTADATTASKIQAARVIYGERAQRGEFPQAEFARVDRSVEAQVLALQQKYDAYGGPWGARFSQTVANLATATVAAMRIADKLADTRSQVGQDAHRAADLTLSMQRNQVFRSRQAMTPQEEQNLNATAQALLTSLQQKYGTGSPDAADFRDRVARLVQSGATSQRAQWDKDAVAARNAATAREDAAMREAAATRDAAAVARAAASRPVATLTPQVAVPQANPESLQVGTAQPTPTPAAVPQRALATPIQRPQRARPSTTESTQPGPPVVPGIPIRQPTVLPGSGTSLTPILLLLLVGGAGAGVYVYRGRRALAPPRTPDINQHHPPPAATEAAPRPQSAMPPPATTTEAGASGVKERLFAERRQKYQARYNDAVDEVTNASIVLTELAPVVGVAQENLRLLSQAVQTRVSALLMAKYGNWRALIMRAATLRTIKHFGLLPKIIVGVVLVSVIFQAFTLVSTLGKILELRSRGTVELRLTGLILQVVVVLFPYLVMVVIFFFLERYFQLKAPLALLKKSAQEFKNTSLIYVFDDQHPHAAANGVSALHAIRVLADGKHAGVQELMIPGGKDLIAGPGMFLVALGALATYRIDRNGHVALVSPASGSGFMGTHGGLVTEAMGEHRQFAATTLPSFGDYGQAAWRKQRAVELLPQLEGLVKDVDRLETLWNDTYCSDPVFEILLRSVDMFNMRDSAAPPGLLLYGYPGNGRKHLAKKIAESISAKFEQVTPSKLSSPDEIRALWESSRGANPTVLFVPNAETVFPRSDNGGGASSRDALEWMTEWEKHEPSESRVWVVMTAESDQSVSRDILQHIGQDSKVEVTAPDAAGRALILRSACRLHQIPGTLPDSVVAATGGVSIQDLRRVVMSVKRASSPNPPQETHWKAAIKNVRGADAKVKDESKTWDRLVLPAKIKAQLQAACRILQNAPEYMKKGIAVPNILLFGPPGTGKTEIARTIANESAASFIGVKLADLKADHIGGSGQNVHHKFAEARAAAPAVLFIDELDGAATKRGAVDSDQFTKEIVTQMLAEMDGATKSDRPVFVLGATNFPDQIDDALLSRFSNRIEIPTPDQEGRVEMLRRILREKAVDPALDIDEIATTIGKRTSGLSGRDLVKLVDRAGQRAVLEAASPQGLFVTRALLIHELEQFAKLAGEAVDENAKWDSLVVSDDTMSKLKQISNSLRNMEARLKQGYDPPKGAILFGPPGTGKTQIAKTLANESGVQYLLKGLTDVQAGYIGQSALKVSALFAEARSKAPCLLFIDEFDKAAASRSGDQSGSFSSDIVTQLLAEMDGAKKTGRPVFVLAATNYLEHIDDAVRSRFSYEIEIPYPTAEQRERLFAIFLSKYPRLDFDIKTMATELARRSGDVGGRDIQQLVMRASQAAAQRAEEAGTQDAIVLTRDDLLGQFARKGAAVSEVDLQKVWSQIVLKPDVKESLLGMIRLFNAGDKAAAKGLLLYGPPGTGKTEIARLLAKSTGCKFLEVKPSDLKGSHVGESGKQVRAQWEKARAYGRCVMFLDECDGVFQRRGGVNSDSFVEEVVNEFLQLWDGVGSKGQVWVVGATNRRDRFDDAIASRFGAALEVGLPEAAQRMEILRLEMQKLERSIEIPGFVGTLTTGFSGRTLSQTAEGVIRLAAQRGGTVTPEMWRETIATLRGATSEHVDESAKWDTLILQERTIQKLQRTCQMLRHAETLQKQGIEVPRGALLFGPPGTGKTQIARTMANESGMTFIAAGPSDIKAGFVGQSGLKVRELFERAQGSAPCILFIDEIEASAAARDGGKADQFTNEIVTEMLTQMDGVKKRVAGRPVFVLAASNFQQLIDTAVLSRFEDRIEIPNPGIDERRRMIVTFVGKRRVDFDIEPVAADLAARCEGMSGRAINALVRRALLQAAQRALDLGVPDEIVLTRDDIASQFSPADSERA